MIALGVLVGCGQTADSPPATAPDATAGPTGGPTIPPQVTLQPTPTLDPAVPTSPPPTPPVTPQAEVPTPPSSARTGPAEPLETAERLAVGRAALEVGDYETAVAQFTAALDEIEAGQQPDVLYDLGLAYLQDDHFDEAATIFYQLISLAGDEAPPEAHFQLARASAALGDYQTALEGYQTYLDANPEMAAYVNPLIAEAHLALDERAAAVAAYEAALEGPAQRFQAIHLRQTLADFYLQDGNYEAAVAQYDAIRDMAFTEKTRGLMTFLAGTAEIQAGNEAAGYERFLSGIEEYPGAYESYLGLVELIKAEIPVDEYQRGLVDFNAAAYQPAIEAFDRAIAADPQGVPADAYRYLALSHEALGNLDAAFAALDQYARTNPAEALIERAKMQARAGQTATAVAAYLEYVESYPDGEQAPFAAWWAAALTEQLGDVETAVARYRDFAGRYPDHEDAPKALYQAGWLAQNGGDSETALDLWQQAAESYPESESGAAALVWLLRTLPDERPDDLAALRELAAGTRSTHYYGLRARDLAADIPPFAPLGEFTLPDDETADLAEAETWLREQFELDPETAVSELSPALRADPRLVVGEKLWRLGLQAEGKWELEELRQDVADDPLSNFQLALYFRDLGLYRSSIIAAMTLLGQSGQSVFEAPGLIGRLAYPAYYAGQISELADRYGYDPRLQLALVRQESLFESFARSGAAAQGLSQVIPDTGAWIAERLAWPDYENEDLYKPYVGLEFGAYYLAQQLEAFDGSVHAALSAYNGGPGNAARWYAAAGDDLDLYERTVDFPETRSYIQRIYAGFDIYRYLYGELTAD